MKNIGSSDVIVAGGGTAGFSAALSAARAGADAILIERNGILGGVATAGLMNAVGNLQPKKLARMCEEIWKGNLARAQKLHYELFEINQAVFYDTNPIPMKYMMKRLGIMPKNEHRLPMMPATKDLEKRLDGVLKRAGLLGGPKEIKRAA